MIESIHADYIQCPDCDESFEGEGSERTLILHRHARHGGPDYYTHQILAKLDALEALIKQTKHD